MPTYIRWRESGATYFFTVVTYRRQHILTQPACRQLLRSAIGEIRQRLEFEMPAAVLLPDHMHCIWTLPPGDDDFPNRWRWIKTLFTRNYLARGGRDWSVTSQSRQQGRRGVWQPRYWEHRIRDEADYLRHRDYIHLNPVKHGFVARPEDWPWSSIHRHIRLGWLDPEWPGRSVVALPEVPE
jgi:putative transposase